MAKRVSKNNKRVQATRSTEGTSSLRSMIDLRRFNLGRQGGNLATNLRSFISAPATMYVAGGIGAALLTRFAIKYYKSHPEISTFVEDKIDTVEGKLKEYRTTLASSNDSVDEATH